MGQTCWNTVNVLKTFKTELIKSLKAFNLDYRTSDRLKTSDWLRSSSGLQDFRPAQGFRLVQDRFRTSGLQTSSGPAQDQFQTSGWFRTAGP